MGTTNRFTKDPEATLDYQVDWEAWLAGDTISTSDWDVPIGLTEDSDSKTTLTATVWLSGGTIGTTYAVVNEIVTVAAREDNRTIYIECMEK